MIYVPKSSSLQVEKLFLDKIKIIPTTKPIKLLKTPLKIGNQLKNLHHRYYYCSI